MNWDKPLSEEQFATLWRANTIKINGKNTNFPDYHGLTLNWGDIHEFFGEPRSQSGPDTAYPKYIAKCKLLCSKLHKVLE